MSDSRESGAVARRRTVLLEDGSYLFEDDLEIESVLDARVITGQAWLLELYLLVSGSVTFRCGDDVVRPATARFGVLFPPHSFARPCFARTSAHVLGVAGTLPLPQAHTDTPVVFEAAFERWPESAAEALDVLACGTGFQPTEANPKASLISVRAKALVDANYLDSPSIGRIADRLGVTHAHLSRQFKRDYGLSPSAYLHHVRLADTSLRLARGEQIVDVSMNAGYNDLSRFYKQYRKVTHTSPGSCRKIVVREPR